jgi:hypothetical protein
MEQKSPCGPASDRSTNIMSSLQDMKPPSHLSSGDAGTMSFPPLERILNPPCYSYSHNTDESAELAKLV